jgi:uncharacterized protein YqhQ
VLRGLGTLGQAMNLGYRALMFSAKAALDDGTAKEGEKPAEISSWMMTANLVFSLGFFIFLYKFVPLFLATRLGKVVPQLSGRFATNMTDGVIRIVIFLAHEGYPPRLRISWRRTQSGLQLRGSPAAHGG